MDVRLETSFFRIRGCYKTCAELTKCVIRCHIMNNWIPGYITSNDGYGGLGWVLSVFFFFLLICFSGHLIDDSNSINNLCYIGGTPAIFLFSSQEWISLNKMSFELLLLSHPLFFSFFFFFFRDIYNPPNPPIVFILSVRCLIE